MTACVLKLKYQGENQLLSIYLTKKAKKSSPNLGAMGEDGAEWRNRLGQDFFGWVNFGAQKFEKWR